MHKSSLMALGFVAVAGGANAQSSFDGMYWGAALGLGWGEAENSAFGLDTPDNSMEGFMASGILGWNGSTGNIVYGVEADLSVGRISDSSPCQNAAWGCRAQLNVMGTLRGRVGYTPGRTLFYLTAGGAAGQSELQTTSPANAQFPDNQTLTGWVAGAGAEGNFGSGGWNYRLEYMYTDFGRETFQLDVPYQSKITSSVVRFGVTKKY